MSDIDLYINVCYTVSNYMLFVRFIAHTYLTNSSNWSWTKCVVILIKGFKETTVVAQEEKFYGY